MSFSDIVDIPTISVDGKVLIQNLEFNPRAGIEKASLKCQCLYGTDDDGNDITADVDIIMSAIVEISQAKIIVNAFEQQSKCFFTIESGLNLGIRGSKLYVRSHVSRRGVRDMPDIDISDNIVATDASALIRWFGETVRKIQRNNNVVVFKKMKIEGGSESEQKD
jgi:hypothetical protein